VPHPVEQATATASVAEATAPSSTFFAQSVASVGPPEEKCDGGMICVQGRLVPEVIQRILHLNRSRFRGCYVDARRAGASPYAFASTFESLSFPQPEGGEVTITYPMVFTPSSP